MPHQAVDQIFRFLPDGEFDRGLIPQSQIVNDVLVTPDDRLYATAENMGRIFEFSSTGDVLKHDFQKFNSKNAFGFDLALGGDTIWAFRPLNGQPEDDYIIGYDLNGQVTHSIDLDVITDKFEGNQDIVGLEVTARGNILALDFSGELFEFTPAGNLVRRLQLPGLPGRMDGAGTRDFTLDHDGNLLVANTFSIPEPSTMSLFASPSALLAFIASAIACRVRDRQRSPTSKQVTTPPRIRSTFAAAARSSSTT
jgi:hypothetical protein